ncbi:MAG: alpha/beta fold hydrolase [Alphaproteobacteria bacterium]
MVAIADDDRMTPPKAGRALATLIKGATAVTIAGAGHMMLVERSDAVLDALEVFF